MLGCYRLSSPKLPIVRGRGGGSLTRQLTRDRDGTCAGRVSPTPRCPTAWQIPCQKGTEGVSALSLSVLREFRWKWSAGLDRMLPTRSSFLSSLHVYCGMAFPVPLHLPRKQPSDVSSAILNRISDADPKTLSAALAQSWIADLEQSIRAAKVSLCSTLLSHWSLNSFPATHP